jgi:hypothetical protein
MANDLNPYAATLSRAKLFPICSKPAAIDRAMQYVAMAKRRSRRVNHRVPAPPWVGKFFHPRTLAEVKILADILKRDEQWFLLANLLGILPSEARVSVLPGKPPCPVSEDSEIPS